MSQNPNREEAVELFLKYNKSESLQKHGFAVEAVMRYCAQKRGADVEKWGMVGLLHDIDYEQFPDQHCVKAKQILEEAQWPEDIVRAVISHGYGICSDVEPLSEMEKVLYAIDELTGLVATTALVRPSQSVLDLKPKSVKKKWKDKRFAAGVDRSIIERGAQMLGVEVNELIVDTIAGMQESAEAIGLKGTVEVV